MTNAIIEVAVQVLSRLAITLIGVFGSWLLSKMAKKTQLANIQSATNELISAAQLTVLELQQTTVEKLKEAAEDGKLSEQEIKSLGEALLTGAKDKMSAPSIDLLIASGVDINKIIIGAGEALIAQMHKN